ncbi:MAG: hypothetical protein Q9201_000309 [Fulgogasparrea decipioides]
MIARHTFGGEFETQVFVGLLAIMATVAALLAYFNIKRLQIDQHRAWMLRTWFYAASIITLRIIMIISAQIISSTSGYYRALPCKQLAYMYDDEQDLQSKFPQCFAANGTTDDFIAVKANFSGSAQVSNALGMTFGTAGWLALFLHGIGIEVYLRLTPRESERLRVVSYERQLEAGFKHPGSAGITADRWGDANAWKPPN